MIYINYTLTIINILIALKLSYAPIKMYLSQYKKKLNIKTKIPTIPSSVEDEDNEKCIFCGGKDRIYLSEVTNLPCISCSR